MNNSHSTSCQQRMPSDAVAPGSVPDGIRQKVLVLEHDGVPSAENHIWNSRNRIVYGPVCSRRWRYSLGINLFPGKKICSLNCTYCDMGRTCCSEPNQVGGLRLVTPDDVVVDIRKRWAELKELNHPVDVVTVCGNGEATLHPHFAAITRAVKQEFQRLAPELPLALMTNSTTVGVHAIQESYHLFDRRVFKLDAGDAETFSRVCAPMSGTPSFAEIAEGLVDVSRELSGGIVISAAAVSSETKHYGNLTSLRQTFPLLVRRIAPSEIHLHNIDYPVIGNDCTVRRLPRQELEGLGADIANAAGVAVTVLHSPISFRDYDTRPVDNDSADPGKRILLVEDDPAMSASLARALRMNCQVVTAQSLDEAKAKFDPSIDAAVLDVCLRRDAPGNRDGLDLLEWVKARSQVPVIVMTAYSDLDPTIVGAAMKAGADRFFGKVVPVGELRLALKSLWEQK